MPTIAIVLVCLFAVYLTLADIGSTEVGKRYGRRHGLMFWIAAVAVPIVVALVFQTKYAIVAMLVSAALSYIAYRKRMHDLNKDSDPEECSDY